MKTLLLAAIIMTSLAVLPVSAQKALGTERSVVGSWKLIRYEDTAENGKTSSPWGKEPSGVLMYDETGHMAVQIQRTPVVHLPAGAESKLSRTDKEKLLDAYTAYFGRYEVDWQKMTITHFVEGNLFPFYNDTAQVKSFVLEDGRLILKVAWSEDGHNMNGIRVFERLKKK